MSESKDWHPMTSTAAFNGSLPARTAGQHQNSLRSAPSGDTVSRPIAVRPCDQLRSFRHMALRVIVPDSRILEQIPRHFLEARLGLQS